MNLEQILSRFTHNAESIIQWLFLFILALSGFLISRWLLFKKSDPGEGAEVAGPGPEVSLVLQQILERTAKLDSATVQPMSPEQVALAETQVQGLKKELSAREDELKALRAAGSGNTGEADKLNARLKELEAKLAEYEILEDDIADLSLYKEENLRLRGELEKLRGAGGGGASPAVEVAESDVAAAIAAAGGADPAPAAAPASEPAPLPTDGPVPPGHDIVAEFESAVSAESVPAPAITMQVPDTGNPMKDFEAAVQIEQKMKGVTPAAAAAAVGVPASVGGTAQAPAAAAAGATAEAPAAKAAAPSGESDDLFAEFTEAPTDNIDTGALDTDKMMAEMAALVNLDPSASALDEGIDVEKMALEAAGSGQKR